MFLPDLVGIIRGLLSPVSCCFCLSSRRGIGVRREALEYPLPFTSLTSQKQILADRGLLSIRARQGPCYLWWDLGERRGCLAT